MNDGRHRRPTLLDVAKVAGVSHTTVSRYLRVPDTLKPRTVELVRAAIEELDYHPNLVARSMRTRRTGTLAIVMPGHLMPYSPARVLASATEAAHLAGFQVEITAVEGGGAERAARAIELVTGDLVEGVLALTELEFSSGVRPHDNIEVAAMYDEHLNGVGPLLDAEAIREIVEGMAALGHTHFIHIGGPDGHPASTQRRRVFAEATAHLGLTAIDSTSGPWDGAYARDVVKALPEDSPVTAIVAGNDELAAGAIAGATERGWSVPERVSVSGWDDSSVGAFMPPALTTVRMDHASLGRAAMERLIATVRGLPKPEPATSPLNTVIWRASVGAAPRHRAAQL
jgi:LacI family repressor for deo operon, udp, cdd, tsx, nupC, and nupG